MTDVRHDVEVIEVGPRDGLQNEPTPVSLENKVKLINTLIDSGLSTLEVTSFVSPKAIPQLQDNEAVFHAINKPPHVHLQALVPNLLGLQKAIKCGVKEISIFTAASETFNQRNIRCSISESIERFRPVVFEARAHHLYIRAYVSCVIGCPYEGEIKPSQVIAVMNALEALGVDEISLGDTIGVGTPRQTQALLHDALSASSTPLAMHFHDTYGQAIANIYASLEMGIKRFDSAVAGLGGCPYAQGATGNVATEDLLYLLHGLGLSTGVDIYKVIHAGQQICQLLNRRNASKVANALLGACGNE